MTRFPDRPFLTERFDFVGGGIDFLGMRQVNLSILQEELIPGINNATSDFGTFCLGTWIPWKFRQLCGEEGKDFVLSRYTAFREAMEIALAFGSRNGSPGNDRFGRPRRSIGERQKFRPPGPMTFKAVNRTFAASLYSAPLYGPALWYLGFIIAHARARDGSSTDIPYVSEDQWTQEIVREVETRLSSSQTFSRVVQVQVPPADAAALDDLALHGLHPSFYRQVRPAVKIAFIRKFLVGDGQDPLADRRRLTARLLCETVQKHTFVNTETGTNVIRACWYANMLPGGLPLVLGSPDLQEHRVRWAIFQARQIQRTIIEGFLHSFELAVHADCRSIGQILMHWEERSPEEVGLILSGTFEDLVRTQATAVSRAQDFLTASRAWHAKIHGDHDLFEDVEPGIDDEELLRGLTMLARWWLRVKLWLHEGLQPQLLEEGGRDRMSIRWFWEWMQNRLAVPVRSLLENLYSEIVFAQHIKVALARFDGKIQRLRFTLGDEGIIPTVEARDELLKAPKRTDDRLDAFIGLLCDVGVLSQDENGTLAVGPHRSLLQEGAGKVRGRVSQTIPQAGS